ncbi:MULTISPECIES: ATP-binding cassette domain-containing protein [16SrI (Aster yellows group)]|uniref:Energy-coupling factor transporter ATP-binding protein EcfA n=3 Tax=16SrI (Aster yellows group) TaxID=3042590 RepID=ECFA_AYWBP|nr:MULTISPECIES: ATP-binding cassette domain-containing protein [16SrI (Aster yellows group)]Q2NIT5.2 RecName: Full=Energy-coupling factor transporter ATP-binding protein EcfA; Short=ECF transporter A component EcfA [Aster yellows witches'-broom phytoplasma AYWB]PEH36159.1 energy-coupling factor transporter ATP-binding protein EcfA [New Jersey aster yellows phytoplasma]
MISIQNLTFYYGCNPILKDINLTIQNNSWVSIVGHNGSGKSTLAKILLGLLAFNKGQIVIDNIVLNEKNLPILRPKIGIVFQNPDYQFTGLTVREDIAFGLENYNVCREEIIAKVLKYAKMVKIDDLLDKNVNQLSGGQKQRVTIASILAMEPEIIIFDEATSFLDPQGALEVQKIIQTIKNKILITITHDLDFASKSDEIIVLYQGKLITQRPPKNLLQDPLFLQQYKLTPPLSLQLYYEILKDSTTKKIKNNQMLENLKDILWQYNLKK